MKINAKKQQLIFTNFHVKKNMKNLPRTDFVMSNINIDDFANFQLLRT